MKLGILTLIHGREVLTRRILPDYVRSRDVHGLDLDLVAVASMEDTWASDLDGWTVLFRENQPLSDKWNAGVEAFRDRGIDALMIVGSDNLVHWTTLLLVAELCTESAPYWMPTGAFFTDGGRTIYRAFHRIGGGRTVHRSLLDRLDWRLFLPGKTSATDHAMDRVLDVEHGRAKRYAAHLLEIKSADENMWTLEHMTHAGLHIEVDAAPVW